MEKFSSEQKHWEFLMCDLTWWNQEQFPLFNLLMLQMPVQWCKWWITQWHVYVICKVICNLFSHIFGIEKANLMSFISEIFSTCLKLKSPYWWYLHTCSTHPRRRHRCTAKPSWCSQITWTHLCPCLCTEQVSTVSIWHEQGLREPDSISAHTWWVVSSWSNKVSGCISVCSCRSEKKRVSKVLLSPCS